MRLMKLTAGSGRATPICSEVLVAFGERAVGLECLPGMQVDLLRSPGSLDLDVAIMNISPAPRMKT